MGLAYQQCTDPIYTFLSLHAIMHQFDKHVAELIMDGLNRNDLLNTISTSKLFASVAEDGIYAAKRIFALHGQASFPIAAKARTCSRTLFVLVDRFKCDTTATHPRDGYSAIHYAAMSGDENVVRYVLGKGEQVDRPGSNGETPLMLAIQHSHGRISGCIRTLLDHGSSQSAVDRNGNSALHVACKVRNSECLLALLAHGWDPKVVNNQDNNAMMVARSRACTECLHEFNSGLINLVRIRDGMTPLMRAAKCGHVKAARHLAALGAELEAKDVYGATAVLYSANAAMLDLFLSLGSDPEARDDMGFTLAHYAASSDKSDVIISLAMSGYTLSARSGDGASPLDMAVTNGAYRAARAIIQTCSRNEVEGMLLNRTSVHGQPGKFIALHIAAHNGDSEMVRILLDASKRTKTIGVRVSGDHLGMLPLHLAVESGNLDVVSMLAHGSADIDALDALGRTPLYKACQDGRIDVIRHLIDLGADLGNTDNIRGENPLFAAIASVKYSEQVMVYFMSLMDKKPLYAINNDGKTLLHVACETNNVNAVGYMLADSSIRHYLLNKRCTVDGWTPLHECVQAYDTISAKLLIEAGANTSQLDHGGRTPLQLALKCKEDEDTAAYDMIIGCLSH